VESEGVGGKESEGVGGRREESEESVVRWSGVGVGSRESEGVGRSRRESEESEDAVNISQEWTPPPTNKSFKNLSRRKWTRSIKKVFKGVKGMNIYRFSKSVCQKYPFEIANHI